MTAKSHFCWVFPDRACAPLMDFATFPQAILFGFAGKNRRDSSSPLFVRRGVRRPLPSLTGVRERSAERRYGLHLAPCGAAYRLTGTRTPRRSTVAFVVPRDRASGAGPEGCPSRYPGGFRHPSSGPVQPLKAAPVVGRTVTRGVPGRGLRIPGRRRHTRLRQLSAPRRRPHVSKACLQYRAIRTAQ